MSTIIQNSHNTEIAAAILEQPIFYNFTKNMGFLDSNSDLRTAITDTKNITVIINTLEQLYLINNKPILGNIIINATLEHKKSYDLTLIAEKNIIFSQNAKLNITGDGDVYLKSAINDTECNSTVIFDNHKQPQIFVKGGRNVYIYYNPILDQNEEDGHKYYNPSVFSGNIWPSFGHRVAYMLVNDIYDLQNTRIFLSGNYALSRNIDALETLKWSNGKGFAPISIPDSSQLSPSPFCGEFDGNGFYIENLYINRPLEDNVGLFGFVMGARTRNVEIKNIELRNFNITGKSFVGAFAGEAYYTALKNILISGDNHINGKNVIGGIIGTASEVEVDITVNITNFQTSFVKGDNITGQYFGSVRDSIIYNDQKLCSDAEQSQELHCSGLAVNLFWG